MRVLSVFKWMQGKKSFKPVSLNFNTGKKRLELVTEFNRLMHISIKKDDREYVEGLDKLLKNIDELFNMLNIFSSKIMFEYDELSYENQYDAFIVVLQVAKKILNELKEKKRLVSGNKDLFVNSLKQKVDALSNRKIKDITLE